MLSKLNRIPYQTHLLLALLLRIVLIIYGEYQDQISEVPYTDIDYRVFTDASRHVLNGSSPYQRHTYRYSPLLAIILTPNILLHGSYGKILFSIVDIFVGLLIFALVKFNRKGYNEAKGESAQKEPLERDYKFIKGVSPQKASSMRDYNFVKRESPEIPEQKIIEGNEKITLRQRKVQKQTSRDSKKDMEGRFGKKSNKGSPISEYPESQGKTVKKSAPNSKFPKNAKISANLIPIYCMCFWLYNPMSFVISTRGNSDSLAVFLVLLTLYYLTVKRNFWVAGLTHGLAIHFRLYPIIYSLAYFMSLSQFSRFECDKKIYSYINGQNDNKNQNIEARKQIPRKKEALGMITGESETFSGLSDDLEKISGKLEGSKVFSGKTKDSERFSGKLEDSKRISGKSNASERKKRERENLETISGKSNASEKKKRETENLETISGKFEVLDRTMMETGNLETILGESVHSGRFSDKFDSLEANSGKFNVFNCISKTLHASETNSEKSDSLEKISGNLELLSPNFEKSLLVPQKSNDLQIVSNLNERRTIFKKKYLFYLLPNRDQLKLIFGTLLALGTFTALFYTLYGYEFLYETYIYHLIRKDTRHNFSLFFYIQYLTANVKNVGIWQKVLCTLPQLVLLLVLSVRYGLNRFTLNFSIVTMTIVMVMYNSVLTSQYFVWIFGLLPLVVWQLDMSIKKGVVMFLGWFIAQLAWLLPAYLLEFMGQNTFFFIWVQGLSFFCANMAVLGRLIKHFMYKVD